MPNKQDIANKWVASPATVELIDAVGDLVRFYRDEIARDPTSDEYNSDLARHVRAVVAVWQKHPGVR